MDASCLFAVILSENIPSEMKAFDTVTEAMKDLRQRGYIHDFKVNRDCLLCDEKAMRLKPEQFEVDEVYRFEGESDPGDENVVYAISAIDQSIKGILMQAYGTYAEGVTRELMQKLQYHPKM